MNQLLPASGFTSSFQA